jgi:UDP-N-acetylmuramoylalanine--D-glutamate ligase
MNFDLHEFDGKEVVFVGAGKGRSSSGVEQFMKRHSKMKIYKNVDKRDGNQPLDFLKNYDPAKTIFIKNEAIPGHEMPVAYITPVQLFFRLAKVNKLLTVGITGTKGKSTTTALTASILQNAGRKMVLAGNIGVSPLPELSNAHPDTIFVLELSSYQLADLNISPHISACLNLYNDHTDWHGTLDSYWEAKHNIMRFAASDDVFIYNPQFEIMRKWAEVAKCRAVVINPEEKIDLSGANLYGDHNVLNCLFAREIARQLGIVDSVSVRSIREFKPLEHRLQTVAIKNNRTYIDDAIGMTPESTVASVVAVSQNVRPIGCLLLGGQDRNYDFGELMKVVANHNIPFLVLFPDTELKMKAALPDYYHPEILETKSMDEAVKFAATHAPEGSVVLLSTAAPSYSLWKDFEDKGNQFQAAITNLG